MGITDWRGWGKFQAAYQSASTDKKKLIDSPKIPKCVKQVIASRRIDEGHHNEVVKIICAFYLDYLDMYLAITEFEELGIPEEVFYEIQKCVET